jgi:hypothetical protein
MADSKALLLSIALASAMLVPDTASGLVADAAPKAEARPMDFSHVTSRALADALVKRGELVKIWLYPKRFGGPNDKYNIGYVPAGTEVALDFAHDRISGLIDLKAIDRMTVKPEYRGKSKVLTAITYVCHGAPDKPPITISIDIW